MQIPPFASLCKYGFWSHERTHSIALTHWPCMHTAVNREALHAGSTVIPALPMAALSCQLYF